MIKKCIIVILISLIPSLGLGQIKVDQLTNDQNYQEQKIQFLSQLIGISFPYSTLSVKLSDFIVDWLGKPYRFGGESKKGIDCSAFSRKLYYEVMDQYLPRNSRQQFKYVKPINKEELQTGDLVFFKIKTRDISHVGVYLSDNKFIQSSKSGVNVASLEHPYWKRYYYKAGRL
jgi:lipoprotein Spr